MKRFTAFASLAALALAPALGSCTAMTDRHDCYSKSRVALPTPDKVRAHLSNGEAGRRVYDAVVAGDMAEVERLVRADPRLLSTNRVLPPGERPSNGNVGDLLSFAIAGCDGAMAAALLELGADPDGTPRGLPLTLAVLADDPTIARMLLQAGADADAVADGGSTALKEALYFERADAVALLLRGGADPNRTDAVGGTPLEAALLFADYASARELLRAGANPWQVANKGTLPARLLVDPVKEGGDEALRRQLLAAVQDGAPIWPPPAESEVRRRVLANEWPDAAMRAAGFTVTPEALASIRRAEASARP